MYGDYPNLEKVDRILVIKLRHLGDVLLSSPVFANLKKRFPDAVIDAYIWKEAHPILEGHPAISGFHLYDRGWKKLSWFKRLGKELALLGQIFKKRYDLVIHLTEGERGVVATGASRARVKVGIVPKKKLWRRVFTHLVKPCPNERHTVERDLDAIRRIGIFPGREERELYFHIPKSAQQSIQNLVPSSFVLIHPVSRWRFKCLPPALMAKVIEALDDVVVLTGAPSEEGFVEAIVKHTSRDVVNLAGQTSLKELGALMQRAKGVITVDSVALHMASALKVPCVALFGPTSEENWGPWQNPYARVVAQRRACRPCRLDGCGGSKMSDCLWTLSVHEIVEAFSKAVAVAGTSELLMSNSLETAKTE